MSEPVRTGRRTRLVRGTLGVEIIKAVDSHDTDFADSDQEADLKMINFEEDELIIHYKVKGRRQTVSIWIEYKESEVHEDFYLRFETDRFTPPKVAVLVNSQVMEPGDYTLAWDGRDSSHHQRLLLAGEYLIKTEGRLGRVVIRKNKTLKVAKPHAANYGIDYIRHGSTESTRPEIEYAYDKQESLNDGTAFEPMMRLANFGDEVADELPLYAIMYFSGHSGPMGIALHTVEGGRYDRDHRSGLFISQGTNDGNRAGYIMPMARAHMRDLFLVMCNGCNSATEVKVVQSVLRFFFPGTADGDHGPKTTGALRTFQNVHRMETRDGTKSPELLQWMQIDPTNMNERQLTRAVQLKLRRYFPGPADNDFGPKTETALENYQADNPQLQVTGQIDEPTKSQLRIGSGAGMLPVNFSQGMISRGADISLGFLHSVTWDPSTRWAEMFWDNLVDGQGVNTAATNATAQTDQRYRDEFEFRVYSQQGVSIEETLHPARYGMAAIPEG